MSLQRRASGSSATDPTVLTRNDSLNGLTEEAIKSASQRFDLEIVFKLTWTHKGLTRICGLDKCINLVELNLAGNQITKIEGLECTLQLRRLVLASNKITRIEGLSQLSRLEALWLQDNRLASLESLALPALAELPALRGLVLQNVDRSAANGACRVAGYKAAVLAALPHLHNLDGERSPCSVNYAALATEYDVFRANPPAPKEVELPEVSPWLAGVDTDVAMGGGAGEAVLQQRHATVVKGIDDCEMLVHLLKAEVSKFGVQLEAKARGQ